MGSKSASIPLCVCHYEYIYATTIHNCSSEVHRNAAGAIMGNSQHKESISIVFLDEDGVLNSQDTNGQIDADKLVLLKAIIDKTEAKIVISSSWRISKLQTLSNALNKYGMEHFDCTPHLIRYRKPEQNRVLEIESYLKNIKKEYKIRTWISIDDYNLIKFNRKLFQNHLVNTSVFHGIRNKDVTQAIQLLL